LKEPAGDCNIPDLAEASNIWAARATARRSATIPRKTARTVSASKNGELREGSDVKRDRQEPEKHGRQNRGVTRRSQQGKYNK